MTTSFGGWVAFVIEKCAMPAALALGGWLVSGALDRDKLALEREKADQAILTRAMSVLFDKTSEERLWGAQVSPEERRVFRAHWIATYNHYARVRLEESAIGVLMEAGIEHGAEVVTLARRPDTIAADPAPKPAGTAQPAPSPRGDGWVSVGRPNTARYADLNFDLLAGAKFNSDGSVPPGSLMVARWSVNLRDNTDVTSGVTNKARGILGAGQCVQVLETQQNVRGATWAFITLDGCDPQR